MNTHSDIVEPSGEDKQPSTCVLLDFFTGKRIQTIEPLPQPKTRGRPKKHNIVRPDNVHTISSGDKEPETRFLRPVSVHKIILDFNEYVSEGLSLRD